MKRGMKSVTKCSSKCGTKNGIAFYLESAYHNNIELRLVTFESASERVTYSCGR